MPIVQGAADYIYEGVWTNWEKGPILGSTLTLSPYHATTYLSPAIAIYVSIAGSQLWRIFQFALHQARARKDASDFLYHQQQVILRNTGADLNALWRLLRLCIAWRNQKHVAVLKESFPLVLWTFIHFVIVIVASVFSTWILNAGTTALSSSPFCGTFDQSYLDKIYSTNASDPTVRKLSMEYSAYMNEKWATVQRQLDVCSSAVEGCHAMQVDELPYSSQLMPHTCPFESGVCHPDIDGSMSFDTGYLSSMKHLGINAPEHARMSFRLTAQCAPLNDEKYTTNWQTVPSSDGTTSKNMADALYGVGAASSRNATYSITELDLSCDQRATISPYWLDSQFCAGGGSVQDFSATFDPIPELQTPEADLSLMLLSFNNAYDDPVYDPWFSASKPYNDSNAFCLGQDKVFYVRDRPLTGLACKQQWQFCNTTKEGDLNEAHCTSPMGIIQLDNSIFAGSGSPAVRFNPDQLAFISRFDQVAVRASFFYLANALSKSTSAPLKARTLISTTVGLPLSSTQWQDETTHWTDLILAYVQQSWLDFGTGQFSPSTEYINITKSMKDSKNLDPVDRAASYMCANQIIRTTVYRNFNFFALMMILVFSTIVIVLGLCVEDIIGFIRQRQLNSKGYSSKQDMWVVDSDIEMLKTISELQGGAVWSRTRNGVPLAGEGMKATIDDLQARNYGVNSAKIFEYSSAGSTPSGGSVRSPNSDKGASCHVHGVGEGCAACSTFNHSRSTSGETSAAEPPTLQYTNTYANNFERGFTRHLDAAE